MPIASALTANSHEAVSGRRGAGMVTSPHPLASAAGAAVLADGGTAAEAAIAMAATIAVVYPHFCGLGGDSVWLLADRAGRQETFLGIGQAAQNLPDFTGDAIPTRGPLSMLTTAATVDAWDAVHRYSKEAWGGRTAFGDLLQDAIGHAKGGFPISRSQGFWLDMRKDMVADWPSFSKLFFKDGKPLDAGDMFYQPDLATVLETLASQGARSFYEGPLARRIAEGLRAAGSPLTADDLAATHTRRVAPARLAYRGYELLAPPPPTQGITTLTIMGILAHFDLHSYAPGSADHLHLTVEAVKQAFLTRHRIADPEFTAQAIDDWLTPEALRQAADAIDSGKALPWPQPYRTGDTVFFGAVDAEGRCVSTLQSTYFDWGSGVVVGDTGMLWQNRGAAFSLDPDSPNCLKPGKRPFYTLNPGIALKDGMPALVYGTQGADGQPQTLSMLLTRLIDYHQSPSEALAGPRFLLGKTFSDSRDSLKIEGDCGDEVLSRLAALGHELSSIPPQSPIAGQAGVITIAQDGNLSGAHDPRGEGVALAVNAR
ncbi:gamma-glutamyltranspeptidase/glutathione hydrolase [Rhizobium taibaishanense]|uniref:Gamma-glutamyltranspeptidase/glutathione hydrolase n=2 Tax=Allorhizobium taibaishanense TaxID=887144 RepID=A0A7W6MUA6_9HYPH|nr:gamma-glutamyltranspeptidase/glutathione hydrolase [Allorhizobium taibaishanense]